MLTGTDSWGCWKTFVNIRESDKHEIIRSGSYISCFGNNFLSSNDYFLLDTKVVRDTPLNNGNCLSFGLKFDFPSISFVQFAIKLRPVNTRVSKYKLETADV